MNTHLSSDQLEAADRFHSAAIHALRHVAREDPASGLSAARLSALSVLVFGGPRTLGELAAAEQVRPPTMTQIIRGLEEAGLVQRAADPGDGRVTRVRATARGKRVLQRARERRTAKLAERLSALDSQEIAIVREAADLVDAALRLSSAPAELAPRGVGSVDSRA
jgi:DNA-binding MarR family transcriptional regulator